MCIIVDPPLFKRLLGKGVAGHKDEFFPAYVWVTTRGARFVGGGTKYREELACLKSTVSVINELARSGKYIRLRCSDVDAAAEKLKNLSPSSDFDDEHLVALVCLSQCQIVCTVDQRAIPFLKSLTLLNEFGSKRSRPKIYSQANNKSLLRDSYICSCHKLRKE